jgi:hypothetical protein
MGVQGPQEAAVWANQAAPGHSILPKYSVAEVIGSTVGRDEETIRTYIKNQEIADKAVGSVATEARVFIKPHLLYQNPS